MKRNSWMIIAKKNGSIEEYGIFFTRKQAKAYSTEVLLRAGFEIVKIYRLTEKKQRAIELLTIHKRA